MKFVYILLLNKILSQQLKKIKCVGDLENRLSKLCQNTTTSKKQSTYYKLIFVFVKSGLTGPLVTVFKLVTSLCISN